MSQTEHVASRRTVLATGVGLAAAVAAPGVTAQPDAVEEHLDGVDTYDGVEDRTGSGEVTVAVGAGDDGLRFDPPSIRVTPGTTVVWEWTGEGGQHNVPEVEGRSSPTSSATRATPSNGRSRSGVRCSTSATLTPGAACAA